MGGSAFSSHSNPLFTPRIPTEVYRRALSRCHAALREIFLYVATPIEGPAKKDHGDLDILVAVDRRSIFPVPGSETTERTDAELMEAVTNALHAEYSIIHGPQAHFAIRWPSDLEHDKRGDTIMTDAQDAVPGIGGTEEKVKYIQVDVRICPNFDQLSWSLYKHAHGDIWNILGSTIRPFGLTIDEEALWIRIPEIEKLDRKQSKVMLSKDPVEILHFLGLKVEGFWTEPFDSIEALFGYAASCRLFWVRRPEEGLDCDGDAVGVTVGDAGRKKLKSNDRRRMTYRPVFRQWIDEYIPSLQALCHSNPEGPQRTVSEQREEVRNQAFAAFRVEAVYNQQLRRWRTERGVLAIKRLIKTTQPDLDPQFRGSLHSALRKILLEGNDELGIISPNALRDSDGVLDVDIARDFVERNWKAIGELALRHNNQKYHEQKSLEAPKRLPDNLN
ncbi:hypothetical protein OQA88_11699 [Cercophora sp. LCS_1]